ncbi:MAG: MotA/TolQ/ExbB proton channel family protein [Oscillospiraceae bacterium]|nr:MotA/TolQ/ExbB proton channel family protein [Oscillospiraceae bacterium]
MDNFLTTALSLFPDILVYGSMAVILLCAIIKCFIPVLRNAGALRHASQLLADGSRMKLTRPVWSDVTFLGKALQREWRNYLQNAESLDAHGQPCDVEEYINDETVIDEPGNAQFADIVPGLCTSLGILGTFIGLTAGLSNISFSEMDLTINQMISGLGSAFQTSIVGLVCSLIFNTSNRIVVGHARKSLLGFVEKFYRYGAPRPIDTANQLVTLQQEQVANMRQFGEELGGSLSIQIEKAVLRALQPVAQSMDRFLEGTTRQQVEGVRHIVNQFVMTMDQVLEGQLHNLGETLEQTVRQQQMLRDDMRQAASIIGAQTNDSEAMQRVARQVLTHFDAYVSALSERGQEIDEKNVVATELLTRLHNASSEQADYLAQLREHQEALEKYLMDYNIWMRGFSETLGGYSQAQRESLSAAATDLRDGAEMLQGSYQSFVENIQDGLSGALGLFDESIQKQTTRITMSMDALMRSAPYGRGVSSQEDNQMREDMRSLTHAIQTLNIQLAQMRQERKEVV